MSEDSYHVYLMNKGSLLFCDCVCVCLFFQSKLLNKGYLLVYTPQSTENLLWKLILENDSLTLVTLENEVRNQANNNRADCGRMILGLNHTHVNYTCIHTSTYTQTHIHTYIHVSLAEWLARLTSNCRRIGAIGLSPSNGLKPNF